MPKCQACPALITFAINEASGRRLPLERWDQVPEDRRPAKPQRYALSNNNLNDLRCIADPEGQFVSHYQTCSDPQRFTRKGKGK
jgi:hypothetical protein